MRAKEVMNEMFVVVQTDETVRQAANAMKYEGTGVVCICDDQHRPIGVLTDRDIVVRVCAEGLDPREVTVGHVMTTGPVTCQDDDEIARVEDLMKDWRTSRILVVDSRGCLIGIVSLAEVWHYDSPLHAGPVSRRITEREFRAPSGRPAPRRG